MAQPPPFRLSTAPARSELHSRRSPTTWPAFAGAASVKAPRRYEGMGLIHRGPHTRST